MTDFTLWKNASEDNLLFPFDLGKGKREMISLAPNATIEIPSRYDSVVNSEAPQLVKVVEEPTPVEISVQKEEEVKPKRKYNKKDKQNGIH